MASQTSHYKASNKNGFLAGELATLLAKHGPNADYKVVISFRGKVRELIVTEDESAAPAVFDQEAVCETPAPEGAESPHFPRDFTSERIPGGSGRRSWDGPRP